MTRDLFEYGEIMKHKIMSRPVVFSESVKYVAQTAPLNNNPKTILGIDVSSYQGDIDWEVVAQSGVSFVYIKATEGGTFVDKSFSKNIRNARAAKIPCGAYHFFHPKIPVRDQVNNFVKAVGALQPGDLQPMLDLESVYEWNHITPTKRIEMIEQWVEGVRVALNCETTLYMSSSFADDVFLGAKQLSKYALWVAFYTEDDAPWVPRPWSTWTFWQFTNRGRVEGIKTAVDLDLFNGTRELLEKFRR